MSQNYYDIARWLHSLGANVNAIRVGRKAPLNNWKHLQEVRQSREELESYPWPKAVGIGVINGRGGWRTYDIDVSPDDVPLRVLLTTLGLADDYPWVWRSGSGEGWVIAVRCDEELPFGVLPAKKKESGVFWGWPAHDDGLPFHHVELRWAHCQTIYPPSLYT